MFQRILIAVIICFIFEATAYGQTNAQQAQRDLEKIIVDIVDKPLSLFEDNDKGNCQSSNLALAAGKANGIYNNIAERRSKDFDVITLPVLSYLRVGDIAAKHGCKDVARDMYMAVIDNYSGAAFSGIRDRARARLDFLK